MREIPTFPTTERRERAPSRKQLFITLVLCLSNFSHSKPWQLNQPLPRAPTRLTKPPFSQSLYSHSLFIYYLCFIFLAYHINFDVGFLFIEKNYLGLENLIDLILCLLCKFFGL
ncbi:hypothetical protein AMTRI_Chr13g118770 [Amborella trichopoda]